MLYQITVHTFLDYVLSDLDYVNSIKTQPQQYYTGFVV